MQNVFLEKIKDSIVRAYIRNSGYILSVDVCKDILARTTFSTYEEKEDKMLGYTRYVLKEGKIYTDVFYERGNPLVKTAMILTHEIGHVIITQSPYIVENTILSSKRALMLESDGNTMGSYITEGFLEEMSVQIWKDPLFQLDLKQIGIKEKYAYKDATFFPIQSYYEEYRTLYNLSNHLLSNSLFLDAFSNNIKRIQKELPISFEEWDALYTEACQSLEVLFKKEVKDSKELLYYFEEYFYKKDLLCEQMRTIYKKKEIEYRETQKKIIEMLFNKYIQNVESLSTLPFTEEQRRKYMIPEWKKKESIEEILTKMPKVELHLHLDGSVRIDTLESLLKRKVSKEEISVTKREDLNAYLTKFDLPVLVMQEKESLTRIARELVEDLHKENVIYAEIRFAPFKHTKVLTGEEVVESVLEGMHHISSVSTKLILCMMRGDDIEKCKKVVDLASSYLKKGVCAVDLAGAEALYKTNAYEEAFAYARERGVPFTVHAGEADGAESIASALSFGTKRIGHGIRILESSSLIKEAKEKKVLFEVCPTSNEHTIPSLSYEMHPIYEMYKKGLQVCVNTDNRTVSDVTLTKEYLHLLENFPFQISDFIKMNENALYGAFIGEIEKERLLEKLHDFTLKKRC